MKHQTIQKIGKVKLGERPVICATLQNSLDSKTLQRIFSLGVRLLEVRVDRFPKKALPLLPTKIKMIRQKGFSIIGTVRWKQEGGGMKASEVERLAIYKQLIPLVDAVDVEVKSKTFLKAVQEAKKRKKVVIASFHDFKKTPPEKVLTGLLKKAKKLHADIFKVAVFARDRKDFFLLQNFTARYRTEKLISISMGPLGKLSRILFPLLGSLVTYASIGKQTAPGQFSVEELAALYYGRRPPKGHPAS